MLLEEGSREANVGSGINAFSSGNHEAKEIILNLKACFIYHIGLPVLQ